MKIDPTERSSLLARQSVDKVKTNKDPGGFDAVLRNSLDKTGPSEGCAGSAVKSMAGPRAIMGIGSGSVITADAQAQVLLDKLENYQKMLADPAMSLRQIQPAVEEMEKQAANSRALISDLHTDHPLKTILMDTIASIDQEITRFNSGYYVDD
jgi:hypothetical protein